jgi:hypothetical protein
LEEDPRLIVLVANVVSLISVTTDTRRSTKPPSSQNDVFCHFDSDGFCRLTTNFELLATAFPTFLEQPDFYF